MLEVDTPQNPVERTMNQTQAVAKGAHQGRSPSPAQKHMSPKHMAPSNVPSVTIRHADKIKALNVEIEKEAQEELQKRQAMKAAKKGVQQVPMKQPRRGNKMQQQQQLMQQQKMGRGNRSASLKGVSKLSKNIIPAKKGQQQKVGKSNQGVQKNVTGRQRNMPPQDHKKGHHGAAKMPGMSKQRGQMNVVQKPVKRAGRQMPVIPPTRGRGRPPKNQ